MDVSISRKSTFKGLVVLATVAFLGVGTFLIEGSHTPTVLGQEMLPLSASSYYASDPVLGYSLRPGVHRFLYDIGGERGYKYVLINEGGTKATSLKTIEGESRPEVWFMGDSFVAGDALSNQETFSWIVQELWPKLRVRNLGCSSHGALHALLRLRDAIDNGRTLPVVLVFFHAAWHADRNVGNSMWLKSFNAPRTFEEEGGRHFAVADLDERGDLEVRYIPYGSDRPAWAEALNAPNSSRENSLQVEKRIFDEIALLSKAHGIRPIIAVISSQIRPETLKSPTLAHLRNLGFQVFDISLPAGTSEMDRLYQQKPGSDVHPTALGHRRYARQLDEWMREQPEFSESSP